MARHERNEVNTDVKAKWIAALRSGEYKQGIGCLHGVREGDEYCCLGVLCALHLNDFGGQWVPYSPSILTYLTETAKLPKEVQKWAGLTTPNPKLGEESCVTLNDGLCGRKCTFPEIADLIEKHL